ncbi:MAG: type II toxin-antitoxin system VapC family toxin [Opitutales bacterium]
MRFHNYADTSFIVPLFIKEDTSESAITEADRLSEPLPLVFLNSLEWVAAINARLYRREITCTIRDAAFVKFREYLQMGFFVRIPIDLDVLREKTEALSNRHTSLNGSRTLDLLHVAAAQMLGCCRFLTFDERQRATADAEGLDTAADT